jgi:hypothetical protein
MNRPSEGTDHARPFFAVLAAVILLVLFFAHRGNEWRRASHRAQSERETAACLEAGGLPHHDYMSGLIQRCDR